MTGLDKIINEIKEESDQTTADILKNGRDKASEITAAAEKETAAAEKELTDKAEATVKQIRQRAADGADLIKKRAVLAAKQEIISETLEAAKQKLYQLSDSDYADFLKKLIPHLEPADVGAVQARKIIRNKDVNLLTRCQNNEYTMDTQLQVGRDAIKGAVELRGNGELIKRAALDDIGGWNNYTITDDLDMSTRLHIKGWDVRFCADACVYEEGIVYLFPLFRQRRRWLEGTIRRYLEYFWAAMWSKKMSLRAQFDMAMYITEFIMPLWFMLEVIFRVVKILTDKVDPYSLHNVLWSSLIVSAVVGLGFFMTIRYSLRKYDNVPRLSSFKQAFETTLYFLIIWFPMELFIFGKILFCKKDMNWGKTAHGLVKEEKQRIIDEINKKLQKLQNRLQEVLKR